MDEELRKMILAAMQSRSQTQDATRVVPTSPEDLKKIGMMSMIQSISNFLARPQNEVNERMKAERPEGPSIGSAPFHPSQLIPLFIRDAMRPAETGPENRLAQLLGYIGQNFGNEALAGGPVAGVRAIARGAAPSLKAIEAAQEIPPLRVPAEAIKIDDISVAIEKALRENSTEEPADFINSINSVFRNWPDPQTSQRNLRGLKEGFEIEAFHGTAADPRGIKKIRAQTEDFTAFKPFSHFGTKKAAEDRLRHLGHTSVLGYDAASGTRVFPVRLRGNFVEVTDLGGWDPDNVALEMRTRGYIGADEEKYLQNNLYQIRHSMSGVYDAKQIEEKQNEFLYDYLKRTGIDGFEYRNAAEDVGSKSYMVFEPKNVRSAFAQFDPAKTNSSDLLATLAAATVAQAAVQNSSKKKEAK